MPEVDTPDRRENIDMNGQEIHLLDMAGNEADPNWRSLLLRRPN
jgi:hypothetical protein